MNARPNAPERHMVQAVIQLANAALKREMGRPNAVRRLCDIAERLVDDAGSAPSMGLDPGRVRQAIAMLRKGSGESLSIAPNM